AVVGVGLIGGSIALAARERLDATVAGFDRSPDALEAAVARGAIARPSASVADAVADAELVFVAVPVGVLQAVVGEVLEAALHDLGTRPTAIDADTHDAILAAVSHLPHVLANVLVAQAAHVLAKGDERLPATGPSFRDATRVAGASSNVWTDIYLSNRDALAL